MFKAGIAKRLGNLSNPHNPNDRRSPFWALPTQSFYKYVLQVQPSLLQLGTQVPFGIIGYQVLSERPSFHTPRQLPGKPYIRVIEELAEPKVCSSG